MKRILAALMAINAALLLSACAQAQAEDVKADEAHEFRSVAEQAERHPELLRERILAWQAEKAAQAEQEAAEAEIEAEPEYEPAREDCGAYSGPQSVMGNPDGLNSFDGTYEFNGRTETFYPTPAVYDDQLWVDEEGFFRTEGGMYVVATDEAPEGSVIEMSKGQALVMDSGTAPGVVDVHTTWGR